MNEQIIYWYKDSFSRFAIIFTWVIFLVWLNLIFLVWIKYPTVQWWYLGFLIALWWILRRMRRIWSKLHYIVTDEAITIVTPWWKKFVLPKEEIESIEQKSIWKFSLMWRGIKYIPRRKEVHFTTSTHNLHYITMKDWRTVVISPREDIEL